MNEKLQNVQWGEYRIGDLFEIKPTKAYKLTNNNLFEKNGLYPVVTNSSTNNGVTGYTNLLPTEKGNMITYSDTTTSDGIFYQPIDFVGYSHIQGLYPLVFKEKWNYKTLIYIVNCFRKVAAGRFDYGNKFNRNIAKGMFIQLPTKDGKIDFEFMESFISELEEERISELSAYLTVSGLDNYELSSEEKEALENLNTVQWEEKNVTDQNGIFNVKNTKNILSTDITPNSGTTPYLCASAENNSISTYIDYKEELKDKGNCIFIGGKTFVVSYQKVDFFSNDSHNLALYLKNENKADKTNQLFMATCVKKGLSHKYSWGNSISNKKIQKDKIMLPTKNNEIDFSYMELLISAVQKLVIKDVVLWKDKKIEATKQVVGRN
nr:restriction endonuclease subunit S [Histophilus somni]